MHAALAQGDNTRRIWCMVAAATLSGNVVLKLTTYACKALHTTHLMRRSRLQRTFTPAQYGSKQVRSRRHASLT
jgi:hypothetical protein